MIKPDMPMMNRKTEPESEMSSEEEISEPPGFAPAPPDSFVAGAPLPPPRKADILSWIRMALRGRSEDTLREVIEEYIGEADHVDPDGDSGQERALIANVLKLRDLKALDVMIPRADIVGIDAGISHADLLKTLSEKQFSRYPVYRETLDDVIGTIHIKDILACLAGGGDIRISTLVRDVPIVSPAMSVLELLILMRENRKHMVLVVDEFGGIDGLVTIGDLIESIIGEIEDEFCQEQQPEIQEKPDGTVLADARFDIEAFESRYGDLLTEEEREDVDTLGGLVFYIAGRVPARGEVLTHDSGMVFEILDADPRRVNRLRIRNIPPKQTT